MGQAKEIVKKWVELYNDGTPESYGSDRFLELYAEHMEWHEMPSDLFQEGRNGNPETIRETLNSNNDFCNRNMESKEIVKGNYINKLHDCFHGSRRRSNRSAN